ncbi:MAG: ribosome biogenesis GTP-binding protein YihA/YsxC [Hyphomicrobiaceae bacterium]|nr:ribosome biogenesis GTP-binding protein YihA/YsxC [Hyphomicrobiaceae bacterium]
MTQTTDENEQRARAIKFFCQPCEFIKGVVNIDGLPDDDRVEVAFAGRSNVGKSSLINALLGRKSIARTSNTPGRTREINFFTLGEKVDERVYVVDMPGYGYARASKSLVEGWNQLIHQYLRGRATLSRVFLLIDARHGLKPNDIEIMEMLDEAAVSYQIVLTKLDKLKKAEQEKIVPEVTKLLTKHPASYPEVIGTSSVKNTGLDDLKLAVFGLL